MGKIVMSEEQRRAVLAGGVESVPETIMATLSANVRARAPTSTYRPPIARDLAL